MAHRVRDWATEVSPGSNLLLLDFSNAYNSVNRQMMLGNIATYAPSFLPYAWYCYGAPAVLQADGFKVMSSQGTQQGDVLGPCFLQFPYSHW